MKKIIGLVFLIGAAFAAAPWAQAADGPWMVRGRVLSLMADNTNDPAVAGAKVELKDKVFPEVDISYFFTKNIAAELVLTYPQKHDVLVEGTKIGSVKELPPTLMVQYHFMPDSDFRPYAGVGVNLTLISSVNLTVPGVTNTEVDKTSVGLAVQVGADWKIEDKWFLNVDLKKVSIKTDVKLDGTKLTTLKIDPLLLSVGVGYRF
jgi:outer membrane protein